MSPRRVRTLIWKEFLQLRRDRTLVALLLIMPIMQLLLFGYVVATDVKNIPTAIVDLDHSATSRRLVDAFAASGYFTIEQRPASEAELQPLLDANLAKAAIVIPEGTQSGLLAGRTVSIGIIVDGSDSQISTVAGGYASQIVAQQNADRMAGLGLSSGAPGLDPSIRVVFNPSLESINSMIPGLIAAILAISLSAIMSQAVVKERESGTLEQLFVTPIRPGEYIIGKVTPYALMAMLQTALVAFLGMWWFGVPFYGNLGVVITGLVLFLLASIGQGLLISLISRTRAQAIQTTIFILLPTIILSGFVFPISSMPDFIRPFTYLMPLRYALDILRNSFMKGSGFADLALPLLALTGFAIALFGTAVAATHRKISD